MEPLPHVHSWIRHCLEGNLPLEELLDRMSRLELVMDREVHEQIVRKFIQKHELSFSLYSKGDCIALARDHTNYGYYDEPDALWFVAAHDPELFMAETVSLEEQGYCRMASLHTHPFNEDYAKEEEQLFTIWCEHAGQEIPHRLNHASGGDMDAWMVGQFSNGAYLLVAMETESGVDIGCYVPIASFVRSLVSDSEDENGGFSALKVFDGKSMRECEISLVEREAIKEMLLPMLTAVYSMVKEAPSSVEELYMIEIPLRLQ